MYKGVFARGVAYSSSEPLEASQLLSDIMLPSFTKVHILRQGGCISRSHGQPVFRQGNRYITPDLDSHNGRGWKMADSVENLGKKTTRKCDRYGNFLT